MYIDEEGVYNFTDQPASSKYKLYIKDWSRAQNKVKRVAQFDETIEAAARAHGIESHLLKAVVKAESDFNPRAVSKKGALGLMQIMPENIQKLEIENPFDPYDNIMGGARYLKELLRRFDGNLPLALAAYNAGPGHVEKLQGIPPFEETEIYVQRVLKYYEFFKQDKENH
ncbi:MAG: lytic transglycosylase domain-containing protein [Syntrophales bacterium]|nr:lytic transglycosylase domain-containing protein [Syntrophales bacterium]MDY0045556.1 lytic transglycosylase domain-containing protein [Syntrophales bacterium]